MYVIPTILAIIGIILLILFIIIQRNKKSLCVLLLIIVACCLTGGLYGTVSTYTVSHTNYSVRLDKEYKNKKSLVKQRNHAKKGTYAYKVDTKPIKQINQNIKTNQLFAKCKRHPYKYAWILG